MAKQCQSEQTSRRHAALEQSLLTLLRTCPLQEISVKDICQMAAIPRRTFYHYFAGKEELTESLIHDLLLACDLAVTPDFSAGQKDLYPRLVAFFRFWREEHREDLKLLLQNGLAPQIIRLALHWVQQEYLRMGNSRQEPPGQAPLVTVAAVTGFFSLLFYWIQTDCAESAEQMAAHSVHFLTHPLISA